MFNIDTGTTPHESVPYAYYVRIQVWTNSYTYYLACFSSQSSYSSKEKYNLSSGVSSGIYFLVVSVAYTFDWEGGIKEALFKIETIFRIIIVTDTLLETL
jgi:hypothetical protein